MPKIAWKAKRKFQIGSQPVLKTLHLGVPAIAATCAAAGNAPGPGAVPRLLTAERRRGAGKR